MNIHLLLNRYEHDHYHGYVYIHGDCCGDGFSYLYGSGHGDGYGDADKVWENDYSYRDKNHDYGDEEYYRTDIMLPEYAF